MTLPSFFSPVLSPFFLVAVAVMASGCSHHLGQAPTDLDLRNDGSPQTRNHLYQTYKVAYADGSIQRPVASKYEARASSDVAANYLASSESASAALETPAVALDRFVHDGAFYSVIFGTGIAAGIVLGLYVGVPSALNSIEGGGEIGQASLDAGTQIAYGGLAGLAASIPLIFLADFAIKPAVGALASADYRSSARFFNQELEERISKGLDESLTRSAPVPPIGDPPAFSHPPAVVPQPEPPHEVPSDEEAMDEDPRPISG
ncbi:MAG: hypothetical protein GY822_32840 [Deltaproteobacteria bacterium]|nr:hypothetical protein [Deltaproteobacteria bacterium]